MGPTGSEQRDVAIALEIKDCFQKKMGDFHILKRSQKHCTSLTYLGMLHMLKLHKLTEKKHKKTKNTADCFYI